MSLPQSYVDWITAFDNQYNPTELQKAHRKCFEQYLETESQAEYFYTHFIKESGWNASEELKDAFMTAYRLGHMKGKYDEKV